MRKSYFIILNNRVNLLARLLKCSHSKLKASQCRSGFEECRFKLLENKLKAAQCPLKTLQTILNPSQCPLKHSQSRFKASHRPVLLSQKRLKASHSKLNVHKTHFLCRNHTESLTKLVLCCSKQTFIEKTSAFLPLWQNKNHTLSFYLRRGRDNSDYLIIFKIGGRYDQP